MYWEALKDEAKVIEANAWARSFLARIFDEQRKLYNLLENERKRRMLLWTLRKEIRVALVLLGPWLGWKLPDMMVRSPEKGLLVIGVLIAMVVIFCATFRKPSAESLKWIDDLQRGQRVVSLCLLRVNEYALSENMEDKACFVLRILEARRGFVYRPVESQWNAIAKNPEAVRSFQELLYVMACIDEGTTILDSVREDFDWLREFGTGLNGYFFADLRKKLDSILL